MKFHYMIDVETLGLGRDPAVTQIACVRFTPEDGLLDCLDMKIALASGNCHIEYGTLKWWLSQDNNLFRKAMSGETPLMGALYRLQAFMTDVGYVWANGPQFDLRILRDAYDKRCITCPWNFRQEYDYRTAVYMTDVERIKPETAHDALSDAQAQALTIIGAHETKRSN